MTFVLVLIQMPENVYEGGLGETDGLLAWAADAVVVVVVVVTCDAAGCGVVVVVVLVVEVVAEPFGAPVASAAVGLVTRVETIRASSVPSVPSPQTPTPAMPLAWTVCSA